MWLIESNFFLRVNLNFMGTHWINRNLRISPSDGETKSDAQIFRHVAFCESITAHNCVPSFHTDLVVLNRLRFRKSRGSPERGARQRNYCDSLVLFTQEEPQEHWQGQTEPAPPCAARGIPSTRFFFERERSFSSLHFVFFSILSSSSHL